MKREVRFLLDKACDSLLLSVEFFNRPHEVGRVCSTLIFLDHSFEMFLKAAILHRGGRIREKRANETIGFHSCIRRALSDGSIKFIIEEQALTLQNMNSLRDAAQHHLLDISENQLYMHAQAGVTIFRDLLDQVFGRDICKLLPNRVLPLATSAPVDLETLFDNETSEIIKLLQPRSRKRIEAQARLRPLAILDASMQGREGQPNASRLDRIGRDLTNGKKWQDIFPGVATMEITTSGIGPSFSLRYTKKEGAPIHVVPEGTPGASVVAVKRVNELDFYNLSITQLAEHINHTVPKAGALVKYLGLEENDNCFKRLRIGKSEFKRYSQESIPIMKEALLTISIEEVWRTHRPGYTNIKKN